MALGPTENDVVREAAQRFIAVLPTGWSGEVSVGSQFVVDRRFDALLTVRAPSGEQGSVPITAKRIIEGRDVASIAESARMIPVGPVVMARYLPATVRQRLTDAGLSWADATGNVRIQLTTPGLFVSDRGADSDPWRGPGRAKGTLKGEPAAKVVRALIDYDRTWSMRELVDVAKASTGATYRVIDFLEEEGLVERADRRIVVREWEPILRRWSADYGFMRNNETTQWIAPRGIDDVLKRARRTSGARYAITSTLAAARWAPYAPARSAMIYVESVRDVADAWDLREADAGANVVLARAAYSVVFERSEQWDGVTMSAVSQVAADLLTGPGRNPSEAEELIDWMKRNEPRWRR